jgi:hypothetical protein
LGPQPQGHFSAALLGTIDRREQTKKKGGGLQVTYHRTTVVSLTRLLFLQQYPPTMVGITWTEKNLDLGFMEARETDFWDHHSKGFARKKNPDKDAFLEKTYNEYIAAFPGRVEAFVFSEIGAGGTPAERKEKTIQVSQQLPQFKRYLPSVLVALSRLVLEPSRQECGKRERGAEQHPQP